jgi:methylmalonyl-CoA/ethylmalonyl-CoA epimerase
MNSGIFRNLHHVCMVVHDLDAAKAFYESVGIGPWFDYPPLTQYQDDLQVEDREAFLGLRYCYADLENVQLQLCQPGPGESPQRRFLEQFGEGVYHLGFSVPDCDAAEQSGVAAGLRVLASGRRPDRSGFTYFDTREQAGVTLEVRAAPKS